MANDTKSAPALVPAATTALVPAATPVPMSPVLQRADDGTYTLRQTPVVISVEAAEALEDAAVVARAAGLSPAQMAKEGAKEYRAQLRKGLTLTIASARANRGTK
jgi:hypothetical protein